MPDRMTIDNDTIKIETLLSLLATYKLLSNFKREQAIDRAIANVTISPEEVNLALQQFQQRYQLTTQEAIQNYCCIYSLADTQLQAIAMREFKIEKFKQQTWGNRLESTFLNRRANLDQAIYSLIRHKNPELLQELFFRIQGGEQSFSELASQYSQGAEAQTGGLIGPVALSKRRGPVDASVACFEMLAKYWQMPFNRHVIKRAIVNQYDRSQKVSLQLCGMIAELMGLNGQLVAIPASAIGQVPTPDLLPWQDT
jgi:hypothetical protein